MFRIDIDHGASLRQHELLQEAERRRLAHESTRPSVEPAARQARVALRPQTAR